MAMIVRVEVVFIVPAIIVGALVFLKGRRRKALFFGILLVAALAYAAVLNTVSHQATSVHRGFFQYMYARVEGYFASMTPVACSHIRLGLIRHRCCDIVPGVVCDSIPVDSASAVADCSIRRPT
jgi:hypothetical protein